MAKIIFACMALAASMAVTLAQTCGTSPTASMRPNRRFDPEGNRIVGGVEARPNSHPWIVSLQSGGSHFCGGTLIRVGSQEQSDIVVTAAHCVADSIPDQVIAGAHDHNNPGSYVVSVSAAKAVSHESYNPDTTMNDIAVIKLSKPIKFNNYIQPACLPAKNVAVSENATGTVAGWGLTKEGGYGVSDILMQVGIPVIGHAKCKQSYSSQGIDIDQSAMLCGGFERGGKDSCQGDSGGPFVFKNPNGSHTLQGVVSFGIGCARPGLPGVYARVSHYMTWIESKIKLLSRA